MKARKRRDYNKYNQERCTVCRAKAMVLLKGGIKRCNYCGKEVRDGDTASGGDLRP